MQKRREKISLLAAEIITKKFNYNSTRFGEWKKRIELDLINLLFWSKLVHQKNTQVLWNSNERKWSLEISQIKYFGYSWILLMMIEKKKCNTKFFLFFFIFLLTFLVCWWLFWLTCEFFFEKSSQKLLQEWEIKNRRKNLIFKLECNQNRDEKEAFLNEQVTFLEL